MKKPIYEKKMAILRDICETSCAYKVVHGAGQATLLFAWF